MSRRYCSSTLFTVLVFALIPVAAGAQDNVADEIRATIIEEFATTRAQLRDDLKFFSDETTYEFWSSGGLLQVVPSAGVILEYETFTLHPKHIMVVVHSEDVATAMFYSEGSMHEKGGDPVSNYRTRVTRTYVREDGRWTPRVAHYSPITAGQGTNNVSPVEE